MTVRGADYPRQPNDHYPTPPEVLDVVFEHVRFSGTIYDPACGKQKRVLRAARRHGLKAKGSDLEVDFFGHGDYGRCDVVTNPPYGTRSGKLALQFIEHALTVTRRHRGRVAMLLPVDYDLAKTRSHIFNHPAFALKIILLDRIKWFDGRSGSVNHAWFIFCWKHKGPPIIKYARIEK